GEDYVGFINDDRSVEAELPDALAQQVDLLPGMPLGVSRIRMHGVERYTLELSIMNERRKPGRLLRAKSPSVRPRHLYWHVDLLFSKAVDVMRGRMTATAG